MARATMPWTCAAFFGQVAMPTSEVGESLGFFARHALQGWRSSRLACGARSSVDFHPRPRLARGSARDFAPLRLWGRGKAVYFVLQLAAQHFKPKSKISLWPRVALACGCVGPTTYCDGRSSWVGLQQVGRAAVAALQVGSAQVRLGAAGKAPAKGRCGSTKHALESCGPCAPPLRSLRDPPGRRVPTCRPSGSATAICCCWCARTVAGSLSLPQHSAQYMRHSMAAARGVAKL